MSCSDLSSQIPFFFGQESWAHVEHQDKIEAAVVWSLGHEKLQIFREKLRGILLFRTTLKRTLRDTKGQS